jgi:hypothetical protein
MDPVASRYQNDFQGKLLLALLCRLAKCFVDGPRYPAEEKVPVMIASTLPQDLMESGLHY